MPLFKFLDKVRVKRPIGLWKRLFMSRHRKKLVDAVGHIGLIQQCHGRDFYTVAFQTETGAKFGCFFEDELEPITE